MIFDNPLSVSLGEYPDAMVATVVDESFFASKDSGMSITAGTQIISVLPKMLDGD